MLHAALDELDLDWEDQCENCRRSGKRAANWATAPAVQVSAHTPFGVVRLAMAIERPVDRQFNCRCFKAPEVCCVELSVGTWDSRLLLNARSEAKLIHGAPLLPLKCGNVSFEDGARVLICLETYRREVAGHLQRVQLHAAVARTAEHRRLAHALGPPPSCDFRMCAFCSMHIEEKLPVKLYRDGTTAGTLVSKLSARTWQLRGTATDIVTPELVEARALVYCVSPRGKRRKPDLQLAAMEEISGL